MILVDTSVWVDHLRIGEASLAALLDDGLVMTHPFVIGELALGNLRHRSAVLDALLYLPMATAATEEDVLNLIEDHRLFGRGIGLVDCHLLAATRLSAGTTLWTRDRRLSEVSERLGLATVLHR